ncbi:hypothetical protein [Dyella sp. GSA-30]|uniref:hypothetical protein n=1 Tax=Dyella sp. GSA-30 TaxID=2994496 RepID=UPI002491A632|nr:hypothetical protein [Dyella sp. GSA-30]BDU20752.1 hypothetical protein DYGSA30_22090 [Dyella sp. GSA-30]
MRSHRYLLGLLCACVSVGALASDPPQSTDAHDVAGFGRSIDSNALAKLSGGTNVTSNMTLTGTVSNNVDTNVATGLNDISSGSFSGATGIPMVIQNTGNNVLIQNATILNVQFQP